MDRSSSLAITALLSVLLLALGTIGYMFIEGWGVIDSLYMTVITLATVGYGEVHEVSQPGRVFTVILIVLGVGFFLYVVGEATDETNLVRAGIDRAKGLITALGTDAENVFLLLTARQLNPDLYVVARASQNVTKKTLAAAGSNMVVSPYDVGARRMAHAILRPSVIDFLELAFADESTDINIEEVRVSASSKLIDRTLKDSGIRQDFNLIILAAKKADGNMLFNPSAESKIAADDTLIAVGESKNLAKLEKILNP